jgi:hypothetical protein
VFSHWPPPHHPAQLALTSPTTPNGPLAVDGPALFQSEPHEFTGLCWTTPLRHHGRPRR